MRGRFSQGTKWSIRCVTLTLSAVTTINEIISIVFILILLSQKPILILENTFFLFVCFSYSFLAPLIKYFEFSLS